MPHEKIKVNYRWVNISLMYIKIRFFYELDNSLQWFQYV